MTTLDTSRPSVLSLFAGAGGLTLGLQRAGFVSVGGVELDEQAGEAFRRNFGAPAVEGHLLALGASAGDIRSVDFDAWARKRRGVGQARLGLIAGGPPCQAFSRIGRGKLNDVRSGGFLHDVRNELWRYFFRAVAALRPAAFLFENVPGMLHHGGCNIAETVCNTGAALGYNVRCAVLNAAAFGVPQTRERLFIFGIAHDLGVVPTFPRGNCQIPLSSGHMGFHTSSRNIFKDPTIFAGVLLPNKPSQRAVSAKEAIGDLPLFDEHLQQWYRARLPCSSLHYRAIRPSPYASLMRSWKGFESSGVVTDHICKATPRDYETFARMEPGDRYPEAVAIAIDRYERARAQWEAYGRRGARPRRKDFVPPYQTDTFQRSGAN